MCFAPYPLFMADRPSVCLMISTRPTAADGKVFDFIEVYQVHSVYLEHLAIFFNLLLLCLLVCLHCIWLFRSGAVVVGKERRECP